MKIAFMRFGLPTELNLATASVNMLGTEIRQGLFFSWIELLHHEVTVYSGIPNKDRQIMKSLSLNPNLHWATKVKYEPIKFPEKEDVLFIEMGVPNTTYTFNNGVEEKSLVKRCAEVIDKFEGKVIYYQHGILPFPFNISKPEGHESELNLKTIFNFDLFRNKEWTILHHFLNEEEFKKSNKEYENKPLDFKFIPLCYSKIDPFYKIRPNPEWDCLFIGSQWDSASKSRGQARPDEISQFYDTPKYKTAVIGKWDEKTVEQFKFLKYLGQLGKHGDAYRYWNNSWSCVWTTSKKIRNLGLIPTRPIMVILSGSLLLADSSIFNINTLIPNTYLVSNSDEVLQHIATAKATSIEEREEERQKQLSYFKTWDELDWTKIIGG